MQYEECKSAAHQLLKKFNIPGNDLALSSLSFDQVKPKHRSALINEYKADYNKEWPGCSSSDQWSAVNWEDQIYVNSKDPSVVESCGQKRADTLAALMSHEIYHIKAKSNYCANESRCLYNHEMMAHMYERLVKKQGEGRVPVLTRSDWHELSNRVFNNYIESQLQGESSKIDKVHALLRKSLRRHMDRVGVSRRVNIKDVDMMVTLGLDHFASSSPISQPTRAKRKHEPDVSERTEFRGRDHKRSRATGLPEVNVVVKDSPGKGQGLFAAEDIFPGMVVAAIPDPQPVDVAQMDDDDFTERRNLPHDAVVWKGDTGFFDARFKDRDDPPEWYRMNHSKRNANVSMRINKKNMSVTWVATETIPKGKELLYHYGIVPKDWRD